MPSETQPQRKDDHPDEGSLELTASLTSWQGPMPPPEVLQAYEDAVPGAGEVIVKNYDAQSSHRRQMEQGLLEQAHSQSRRGQYMACVIALAGIAASCLIAIFASPWTGAAMFGLELLALAGLFLMASRNANKE